MLILPLIKFFYTNLEDVVDYLLDFTRDFLCCILDSFKSKPMSNDFRMEIPLAILGALLDVCRYPSILIDRLDVFQEHKLSNHYEEADQVYRNRIDSMPCFEQIA